MFQCNMCRKQRLIPALPVISGGETLRKVMSMQLNEQAVSIDERIKETDQVIETYILPFVAVEASSEGGILTSSARRIDMKSIQHSGCN